MAKIQGRRCHRTKEPAIPPERSAQMARVRGKHTKPELIVRKLIHGMGYRFRLHQRTLPGQPDLVFASRHKVIFVNGCFWHRHPGCNNARLPKTRLEFWLPKLESNRKRDLRNQRKLRSMGYGVMVIWECQTRHPEKLKKRVTQFLEKGSD